MTIYESSTPVLMEVQSDGAGYALILLSAAAGPMALGATDAARASTVGVGVEVRVSPADPDITIDSVTATPIRDAPSTVAWTVDSGTQVTAFPAPETEGEYMWDLVVTVTVGPSVHRRVVQLDPKMIVRKTFP
ncbi:hypothetical protein [Nannocystis punicea]|uniref:Uncharacterized protein n=1 Tax=Nannocystis punicea TaxID=2995304 RepID=A0ABY7H5K7_9BACT|nr:hypothetical protein [Nannocystis poenicansa]WAS94559.1 hypothetical protein O0S08_00230 [Nannocystis poenicansa]